MAETWTHPLSGFTYDIEAVAAYLWERKPENGRCYDWWAPSKREAWRDGVWIDERTGVAMTQPYPDEPPHPVYLLSFEVEIAAWKYLALKQGNFAAMVVPRSDGSGEEPYQCRILGHPNPKLVPNGIYERVSDLDG